MRVCQKKARHAIILIHRREVITKLMVLAYNPKDAPRHCLSNTLTLRLFTRSVVHALQSTCNFAELFFPSFFFVFALFDFSQIQIQRIFKEKQNELRQKLTFKKKIWEIFQNN